MTDEEITRRIRSMSWKVYREARRAGATSLERADIEQELWIAYCKARDSFNPEYGVPFGAYLTNGLKKFAAGMMRNQVYNRIAEEWAVSMSNHSDDDDGPSIGDRLPSPDPTPDRLVEATNIMEWAESRLSERARLFLQILHEPPQALLEEIKIAEARSDYARSLGVTHMHYSAVTTAAVFKVMDADRRERGHILKEVRAIGNRIVEMN